MEAPQSFTPKGSDKGRLLDFDYFTAFKRNLGILTQSEMSVLRNARVAIPGMGGVGGAHLVALARLGIGRFNIADPDTFELANHNRQFGAFLSTRGKSKVSVMQAIAEDINPEIQFNTWKTAIDATNTDDFLDGCDLLVDALDAFVIDERRMLFKKAQGKGIPIISAGPLGFSASMITFDSRSPLIDDYFGFKDNASARENFVRFLLGVCPRPHFLSYLQQQSINSAEHAGPSISPAIHLCAGMAGAQAVKLILGRGKIHSVPAYTYIDPYLMKFKTGRIWWGYRNPIQRLLFWLFLKRVPK